MNDNPQLGTLGVHVKLPSGEVAVCVAYSDEAAEIVTAKGVSVSVTRQDVGNASPEEAQEFNRQNKLD